MRGSGRRQRRWFSRSGRPCPYGRATRTDQGERGRFRCFSRAEIAKRNDSLDISWLQDDSVRRTEDLPEPADLADQILGQLSIATEEMQELARLLGETGE